MTCKTYHQSEKEKFENYRVPSLYESIIGLIPSCAQQLTAQQTPQQCVFAVADFPGKLSAYYIRFQDKISPTKIPSKKNNNNNFVLASFFCSCVVSVCSSLCSRQDCGLQFQQVRAQRHSKGFFPGGFLWGGFYPVTVQKIFSPNIFYTLFQNND